MAFTSFHHPERAFNSFKWAVYYLIRKAISRCERKLFFFFWWENVTRHVSSICENRLATKSEWEVTRRKDSRKIFPHIDFDSDATCDGCATRFSVWRGERVSLQHKKRQPIFLHTTHVEEKSETKGKRFTSFITRFTTCWHSFGSAAWKTNHKNYFHEFFSCEWIKKRIKKS